MWLRLALARSCGEFECFCDKYRLKAPLLFSAIVPSLYTRRKEGRKEGRNRKTPFEITIFLF